MNAATVVGKVFSDCRKAHRAAFIPFFVAGDPDLRRSLAYVSAAAANGADLIEIGIPYGDPLADGPTIVRASHRSLAGGMTFDGALLFGQACAAWSSGIPLIAFTYYNPVFVRGIDQTARDFERMGFSGIVVPDLPFAESQPLYEAFERRGLSVTFLVAPTTPASRAAQIAACCTDFVYVVSRMGTTGAAGGVDPSLGVRLSELRQLTNKPLAVGFGIDSEQTAKTVARDADAVIVGSALLDRIETANSSRAALACVRSSCLRLAAACRRPQPVPYTGGGQLQ